jgi:CDP-diacylglycerol--serine O-phosphatidyltransferase
MHEEKKRRRKIRHITFPALPTACTLANGVCGLAAIAVVTSKVPDHTQIDLAFYAALLIFLGMVFDMLDGHIARITRQTSQFGKELDSLCDVITFGVAPVFIMLTYNGVFQRRLLWGIGVLYAVSAILRLARFNVQKDEHAPTNYFRGLPTPMAAGAIASFAIATPSLLELTDVLMPEPTQEWARQINTATMVIVPILTGVLAWLMVSHVRYPHVASALARRRSFSQLVELVFAMVVAVTLKEFALPVLFGYFVFAPPINQLRLRTMARSGDRGDRVAGRRSRGRLVGSRAGGEQQASQSQGPPSAR